MYGFHNIIIVTHTQIQSSKSANVNAIKQARTQGMIAAYLNFAAVITALALATVVIGLVVGIEARDYNLRMCINRGRLLTHFVVVETYLSSFI